MSATDTTLATLRKVVAHAGEGALPEGWRLVPGKESSWPLVTGNGTVLHRSDARDLLVGYWLRRLVESRERTVPCIYEFESLADYILALPAAEARRVFARKDGES